MRPSIKKIALGKNALSQFLFAVFSTSKISSVLLVICTLLSLVIANVESLSSVYVSFWKNEWWDMQAWHIPTSPLLIINDILMPFFFFTIGYEVKHEIFSPDGSLHTMKKAMLPLLAAIGGVAVPAGIYLVANWGEASLSGWAIPTATDIAFSLAAVSILDRRVPNAAKIFLMALAIFDDILAVMIIAVFYGSGSMEWAYMGYAAIMAILLYVLSHKASDHLLVGVAMTILSIGIWYAFLQMGLHPTLAGIVIVFLLHHKDTERSFAMFNRAVSFVILPLFVLANTAIPIDGHAIYQLLSPLSLGIILGLVFGKPLGIVCIAWLSSQVRLTSLPHQTRLVHLIGVGFLAGIGFTMSILIANLSFRDEGDINVAKLAVILASVLAGLLGVMLIRFFTKKPNT